MSYLQQQLFDTRTYRANDLDSLGLHLEELLFQASQGAPADRHVLQIQDINDQQYLQVHPMRKIIYSIHYRQTLPDHILVCEFDLPQRALI